MTAKFENCEATLAPRGSLSCKRSSRSFPVMHRLSSPCLSINKHFLIKNTVRSPGRQTYQNIFPFPDIGETQAAPMCFSNNKKPPDGSFSFLLPFFSFLSPLFSFYDDFVFKTTMLFFGLVTKNPSRFLNLKNISPYSRLSLVSSNFLSSIPRLLPC